MDHTEVELNNHHNQKVFYNNHHHPSSHSLSVTTPGQIIRKLSHSKIIVHFPTILYSNAGEKDKKEGLDLINPGEQAEDGKMGADSIIDEELAPPLQMKKPRKDLHAKLKGLPGGKYLGLILALFASIIISLATLIAKSMTDYHPFTLVLWRLQGVLWPSVALLTYIRINQGDEIFKPVMFATSKGKWMVPLLLVLRGFLGCSSDVLQYCSLKYLSLADSSVVAFSTPIFVTFVAYFVLGETMGFVPIITGIMSLIGVVIISRPPMLTGEESFDTDILIGNGLALGCMMMATLTFVLLRSLRHLHFSISTFAFGFFGTIESLILCAVIWTFELPNGVHDWVLGISIAVLYCIGQLVFTLSLQLEDAGPVSLVRTCDVIFAYIWQYLFLNVIPDSYSMIGGGIVISGVLITGFRKFIQELPESDSRRKTLWFLLR